VKRSPVARLAGAECRDRLALLSRRSVSFPPLTGASALLRSIPSAPRILTHFSFTKCGGIVIYFFFPPILQKKKNNKSTIKKFRIKLNMITKIHLA
jgi:hypothetical protein